MKAWVVRRRGNPWDVFALERDFPEPTHEALEKLTWGLEGLRPRRPGDQPIGEYVIFRPSLATLAWPDVTMATGAYPVEVALPYVSGQEAVGRVVDATPGYRHLIGRRVAGFTPQPFGSFAEVSVIGRSTLYEAPEGMSDAEAACFVIAGHTAYHAVHRRGGVRAGETVVVLGAAGGVPAAAVQLCVAAGARTVAVAGGPEKADFCRKLGAQVVIDHRAEDFVAAIEREVGRGRVDAIIDFVQGEPGRRARPLLAVEGRHVMAGHAGGLIPVHPHEFYMQNWTLIGCCMGAGYGERSVEIERESHAALLALWKSGKYRPLPGRTIGFDEIPAALCDIVERRVLGRIVARIA
jgi:NADPH2:quinone reductase